MFRPKIIVILEPRISGTEADEACRRIAFPNWVRSEANGFSGGILVLWNGREVSVRVIHVMHQFIHLVLREKNGHVWELMAVYASPNCTIRSCLWQQLKDIHHLYSYVLIGISIAF